MKMDVSLCNNLRSMRTRLDLSQQDLANIVGVTRQTIGSLEAGQYAPSIAMCLRLAKALDCKVEDLFWLDGDRLEIEAIIAETDSDEQPSQVTLAKVGEQWIAYPLVGNDAFRMEMIPSDGETLAEKKFPNITQLALSQDIVKSNKSYLQNEKNKVVVRLVDDVDKLQNTVVIAGCTPVLSLLAKATERWYPKLRVNYRFAHSMKALRSLCQGEVHIAGMHLYDPQTGEHNVPFVRAALAGRKAMIISLGVWQEGLLVPAGNPMGVKTVADLVEFDATIITQEPGSAGRMLLERKLQEQRVPLQSVKKFDCIAHNHQDVALSVASGMVDAGISTASIAATFGLGFIPLHQARYDLVILKEYLEQSPVQQFINILGHQVVRSHLQVLGGYDISNIGEVIANV
ncbi:MULTISPECIES: substrate-binding domain-containing protein [unclassified Tolypothrix]|uniref:substrate-binding domain-containing protein n=1 Tax=unclassified Tolypothrix TaxID=2649714 RepID=UPI0005EAA864|nr:MULTISPECIES: substrate-binding domain-containing protein [unclassified Tolypothrix]BAY91263.1 transcriptional Regulator of molybdate metabolism, XRE family protein [Microchaete diplosiphon NIES-3275]EKF04213.1 putative Xre family transcription regulator [Tolypothrix sp. PCC 7601]MBE9080902.1 helix-turn-helix domain-containing protein [Tolypothrix sp. LEGE 11397]UYD25336.1 helix-turn-helix domain-containing protein [Tolypothrix sp. PCC 7712]UYD32420.1 helix-turn-helix domain-containing prot